MTALVTAMSVAAAAKPIPKHRIASAELKRFRPRTRPASRRSCNSTCRTHIFHSSEHSERSIRGVISLEREPNCRIRVESHCQPAQHFPLPVGHPHALSGGRTWWAHFKFTRINIELTILHKKIEDLREARASMFLEAAC